MATADDELERLTRGAIELARRGQPDDVRARLQQIGERTSATGRERAALARFVAMARGCPCRNDADCLHVLQALRLTEYLASRPLSRPSPDAG
ncbi:MAG: hypothetical protein QOG87_279 [Actinomycetota bacterium]